MTKNRERLIMWIVLELIFIALVFIGSVYDFNITYALSGVTVQGGKLVSNVSCIAKALEVLGEWPALLFTSFALCVIVKNIRKLVKKSNLALLFVVLCDVAVLGLIFRGWHASFKDVFGAIKGWYFAIIIPLTLVLSFLIRLSVSKIDKQTVKRFFMPAVVTVITAAVILLVFEAIKYSWGRVRMREIVAANDPNLFTSWYVPNWFSGSKSFPSGHMGYATLLFMIPIWFDGKDVDKKRRITYLAMGSYLLIMGFSRLCAAAHYLTDITFGFAISFIITQIATVKYEKTFRQKPIPKFIKTTEMTTGPINGTPTQQTPPPQQQPAQPTQPRQAQAAPTPAPMPAQAQKQAQEPKPQQRPAPEKAPVQEENSKFIPKSKLVKRRKTLKELLGLDKKKPQKKAAPKPKVEPKKPAPQQPKPKPPVEKKVAEKPPVEKPSQSAAAENAAIAMAAKHSEEPKGKVDDAPTPTMTSFSLEKARAEKAKREAEITARNQAEAKKIDDSLKMAVTGEIKDISVPVEPKAKSQSTSVKRKAPSKPGTRKKAAPKDDTAVQMHFKFDSETNTLTSDISDD